MFWADQDILVASTLSLRQIILCHGSMSYRQDFRRNVAPCTAVPAQEHASSRTSPVLRWQIRELLGLPPVENLSSAYHPLFRDLSAVCQRDWKFALAEGAVPPRNLLMKIVQCVNGPLAAKHTSTYPQQGYSFQWHRSWTWLTY